jgi:N-acyl homoserine lactone hydrolase
MAVSTVPKRAALPLAGGSEGAGVAVTPMRTGSSLVPPGYVQRPRGPAPVARGLAARRSRWTPVPVACFLVEHPTVGPVLVDTGLPAAAAESAAAAFGRRGALVLPRARVDRASTLTARLAERDLDPLDIEVVVMTHLHYDHAGTIAELPSSTFVVDQAEWEAAASGGVRQGYVRRLFDHAFDWRAIDFAGRAVTSFASFGRTIDLFGDGSVRMLSTPGHTLGHVSVLLRLGSGRELLLTGDAAVARRSIDEQLVPLFTADLHLYRRSLREIRRYVEQTPSAEVVCGHDADGWPQVRARYE